MQFRLQPQLAVAASCVAVAMFAVAPPAAAQHRSIEIDGPYHSAPAPAYGDRDWSPHARHDRRAPQIVDVSPAHGERVVERGRTRISARIFERRSGIADFRLRVDGRDVTGRTRFDGEEVRYRDYLPPGRHWAELVVRDGAGNTSRQAWSFDVVPDTPWGGGHGGYRPGYYGYQR